MPHILKARQIAEKLIDAVDLMSKVEANQGASVEGWSTTQIGTAMDTLNDYINDTASDLAGNVEALENALPN